MDQIFQILANCELVDNLVNTRRYFNERNNLMISKRKFKIKNNVSMLYKSIRNPRVFCRKLDSVDRVMFFDISLGELEKLTKNINLTGKLIVIKPVKFEKDIILKIIELIRNFPISNQYSPTIQTSYQQTTQLSSMPEPVFSNNWIPTSSPVYPPSWHQPSTSGVQPYETSPQWLDLSTSTNFARFNRK